MTVFGFRSEIIEEMVKQGYEVYVSFPNGPFGEGEEISKVFESATLVHPKVIAPLINLSKNDIVRIALENNVPLEFLRSCYKGTKKHCGVCESCTHLKKALLNNDAQRYIDILFGE